jgi:uncharacterized protein (DUF924 family)
MFEEILKFWFEDIKQSQWWRKDEAFDGMIRDKYLALHGRATKCELYQWRATARGRLAEIIVLDQFSRNIYRDQAGSFAADALALALAQEAIALGADKQLTVLEQGFLYMPFMHSESAAIHIDAIALYEACGLASSLAFERKHKEIIDRFGRYPHRNAILARTSTPPEIEFLSLPSSSF